jgi:CHAT domain-containing protein
LSDVLEYQGDRKEALRCAAEALAIERDVVEENGTPYGDRELAIACQKMAYLCLRAEERVLAKRYCVEAIDMWRHMGAAKLSPGAIRCFVGSLQLLAKICRMSGEYGEAGALLDEAITLYEGVSKGGVTKRDLAAVEGQRGLLCSVAGQHLEAIRHARNAKSLADEHFGGGRFPDGDSDYCAVWCNYAIVMHAAGEGSEAAGAALRAVQMQNQFLVRNIVGLSETESINVVAETALVRGLLLSTWPRTSDTIGELYTALWAQRGVVQRVMTHRREVGRKRESCSDQGAFAEYQSVAQRLTWLLLHKNDASEQVLSDLTSRKEALERELFRTQQDELASEALEESGPTALQEHLPRDYAFVDLFHFVEIPKEWKGVGKLLDEGVGKYVAFVVQQGEPLHCVTLGPADEIDALVRAFRSDIERGDTGSDAGAQLTDLVWDEVQAVFSSRVTSIYLCPDAALTAIPWAALPQKDGGGPLIEQYAFAIIPSGHHLVRQLRTGRTGVCRAGNGLLVGNVDFGCQLREGVPHDTLVATRSAVGQVRGKKWAPLPASLVEVEHIAELADGGTVTTLSGSQASTERVLEELPKSNWAHFATHGFFASAAFESVNTKLFPKKLTLQSLDHRSERVSAAERNPLLLSGLVLAGADKWEEAGDSQNSGNHAVLTAEAISYLPLDGLELAVLSACDTGIGDVAGGEGVLGLQRAFHIAGATNVVASLWKIDDEMTCALMEIFYRKMWREGKTPMQALRESQLDVYHRRGPISSLRSARGVNLSETSAIGSAPEVRDGAFKGVAPRYWAAFVLSGVGR